MKQENQQYNKVLELLRKSKPVLGSADVIEEKVLSRISKRNKLRFEIFCLIDFLFSWVYIGWIRRSLETAAVALVLVFIYQQTVILNEINYLSHQVTNTEIPKKYISTENISRKLMLYRLPLLRSQYGHMEFSEKQINELIQSMDEMKNEYQDLLKLIDDDPELKKLVEEKMTEINKRKIKL